MICAACGSDKAKRIGSSAHVLCSDCEGQALDRLDAIMTMLAGDGVTISGMGQGEIIVYQNGDEVAAGPVEEVYATVRPMLSEGGAA